MSQQLWDILQNVLKEAQTGKISQDNSSLKNYVTEPQTSL